MTEDHDEPAYDRGVTLSGIAIPFWDLTAFFLKAIWAFILASIVATAMLVSILWLIRAVAGQGR